MGKDGQKDGVATMPTTAGPVNNRRESYTCEATKKINIRRQKYQIYLIFIPYLEKNIGDANVYKF